MTDQVLAAIKVVDSIFERGGARGFIAHRESSVPIKHLDAVTMRLLVEALAEHWNVKLVSTPPIDPSFGVQLELLEQQVGP